jgi:hypothetical protein
MCTDFLDTLKKIVVEMKLAQKKLELGDLPDDKLNLELTKEREYLQQSNNTLQQAFAIGQQAGRDSTDVK